jgi:hypothetical protein
MAAITLNKGVVDTLGLKYQVRAHNTNADALSNNATASTFVQATFTARGEESTKRINAEKALHWDAGVSKYKERLRNIKTQNDLILQSGAIESTDSDAVTFLSNLINRPMVWVSRDGGTTWEQAYCTNDNMRLIGLREFKDFTLNLTLSTITVP